MRSLIVGRFQPMHIGHLRMIEYVVDRSKYLTIGLGSCNTSSTFENPFTAEEREEMIKDSLDLMIPYDIKRIPDFGDNDKWINWIKENLRFDVFWTNSSLEHKIFSNAGYKVNEIPSFEREMYSATEVRKRILSDGDWANLLPIGAVKVLSKIDGVYRIKKLSTH